MKKIENLLYSDRHSEALDVYLPDAAGFRTIVYFHGGGLEKGDKAKTSMAEIAERLCANGYGVVSANYRMYPNAKFPDYLIDAADAAAFAKAHLAEWGGCGELIIAGQSAGAWITLMLCMDEHYLRDVGIDPHEIVGWISDSAQTTAHYNVQQYELGEHKYAQRINEYAPQFFVGEKTDFSRMLLIFYENDMPCRPQQNLLFYQSILTFRPEADIEHTLLPGKHCHGSSKKDEDGEYAFIKVTLDWLTRKGL
jgi:dipeptidyl aminopeptidase/acylaminoacyl peptidase